MEGREKKIFHKKFIFSLYISRNVDIYQHSYMSPGEVSDVSKT